MVADASGVGNRIVSGQAAWLESSRVGWVIRGITENRFVATMSELKASERDC